jgi:hypothetical protein
LQPRRDIHRFPVKVCAIRVANVNPNTKSDRLLRWLITVVDGNLPLDLDGAPHRTINAAERNEQGVATCLDDPAAMLLNGRIDQLGA